MKSINLILMFVIIFSLLVFTACESSTKMTANSGIPNSNTASNNLSNNKTPIVSGNQEPIFATPTDAAREVYDALKQKDAVRLRKVFSTDSLKKLEEVGKEKGKSVDEVITILIETGPVGDSFKSQNEIIDGDKATIELPDKRGNWTKNKFVKENGSWRISVL